MLGVSFGGFGLLPLFPGLAMACICRQAASGELEHCFSRSGFDPR